MILILILHCDLYRMSIRMIGKNGRIQELDIDDVMGSDFDVSDEVEDEELGNSSEVQYADNNILPDVDVDTQMEGEVRPNEEDMDEDRELTALMDVFHSMESEFMNNNIANVSDISESLDFSASSHQTRESSPLAVPLSPTGDPNLLDTILDGPSSSTPCTPTTAAKLKISPLLFNLNQTWSPVKTRKKRKQDSVSKTSSPTHTVSSATVKRKFGVPASRTAHSRSPPTRKRRVSALTQATTPGTSKKPNNRVKIATKKVKKRPSAREKLSTVLKWIKKKYNYDYEAFTGQTDLDDTFLNLVTPYEFFKYFFDDDLVEHIVRESNRYCTTKTSKPMNINAYDLLRYFGILTFSAVIQCTNMRTYWHSDVGHPLVLNTMPVPKFEKIREFLHFTNNVAQKDSTECGYDPMFKIRPVIESTRQKCRSILFEERLAVDEQMCATKCHHRLKYTCPINRIHGFKFFVLSGVSGFAYDYEIYAGPVDMSDRNIRWKGEKDLGSSSHVVVRLARYIPKHRFHQLYFDNYYTSLPLVIFLWQLGIYSVGTVRRNRVVNCRISNCRKERGVTDEYTAKYSGCTIRNVAWMDNKEVMLLSTFLGAEPYATVERWNRKTKKHDVLQCQNIITQYNKYMGGVDSLDTTSGRSKIRMKTRKFYMRLFNHILDLCIINAWVLYRRVQKQKGLKAKLTIIEFRIQLAVTLMKLVTSTVPTNRGRPSSNANVTDVMLKKKAPRVSRPPKEVRLDLLDHWPEHTIQKMRCMRKGYRGFSRTKCTKCLIWLCYNDEKNCFQ